jgi:hypothetical protein
MFSNHMNCNVPQRISKTICALQDYVRLGMYREWKKIEFPEGYYT